MTDPVTDIGEGIEHATRRPRGRPRRDAGAPVRSLPRGEVRGRNGEVLTRSVQAQGDQFEIPAGLKEPGWDYQWLSEKVIGNSDVTRRHNHVMYQVGWRPVSATGRWNGVFGPKSDTGHIIVSDMGLYERPAQLSEEARAEDENRARTQMRDRDQALMGGKANARGNIGNGMAMGGKYRGTGGDIRMSIDPALDVEKPAYQPADDEAP